MANRRQLYKYKGDRCCYCGLTVQKMIDRFGTFDRMFEFNHVDPHDKHPNYDNLIQRVISTEQLNEVDKCVLLCRECHGIVHAQNITGELLLRFVVGKKSAEQRLKGQMILDRLDRRATFLTCETVLVAPYQVMLGARKPKVVFGTELGPGGLLDTYLKKLPQHKAVTIRPYRDKTVLMRAEYLGDDRISIVYSIRFPVLTCELGGGDGAPTVLWTRNGVGVTKDGEVIRDGEVTLEASLPRGATYS